MKQMVQYHLCKKGKAVLPVFSACPCECGKVWKGTCGIITMLFLGKQKGR